MIKRSFKNLHLTPQEKNMWLRCWIMVTRWRMSISGTRCDSEKISKSVFYRLKEKFKTIIADTDGETSLWNIQKYFNRLNKIILENDGVQKVRSFWGSFRPASEQPRILAQDIENELSKRLELACSIKEALKLISKYL